MIKKTTSTDEISITIQSGVDNKYKSIAEFTVHSSQPFDSKMPFNIRQKTWKQVQWPMISNTDQITSITINDVIDVSDKCITVWIKVETLKQNLQLLDVEISAVHNGEKLVKLIKEERLLVRTTNTFPYNTNSTNQMLLAIRHNNLQTIETSLINDADPNANERSFFSYMPLYLAITSGLDMVRILVKHGARVNAVSGQTPLYRAAELGKLDIVQYLVSQNADVDYLGTKGPALLVAIQNHHRKVVEYLLSKTSQHIRVKVVRQITNEEYKTLIQHSITQKTVPSIPVISGETGDVAINKIVLPIQKIVSLLRVHNTSEALYELMHVKNLLFNLLPERKETIILSFMDCLAGNNTANLSKELKNELFSCLKLMVLSNLKETRSSIQFNDTRDKIISPILAHKSSIEKSMKLELSKKRDCKDIFFGYKNIYELSVCEIYLNIQLDYIDNPRFSYKIKVNFSDVVEQLIKVAAGNPVAAIWLVTVGAARLIELGYKITEDKLNAVVAVIEMYNNVVIYSSSLEEETAFKILADTQDVFEEYSKNITLERSWLIFYGCIDVLINLSFRTFPHGGHELKSRILSFLTRKIPFKAEGLFANTLIVNQEFKLRIEAKIIEAISILSRNTEVQKLAIESLRALLNYNTYSTEHQIGEEWVNLETFTSFLTIVESAEEHEKISSNLCANAPNALYQSKVWPSLCKEMLEQLLILRPSILAEIKNIRSMYALTDDQQVNDILKRFLSTDEIKEKIMSKITHFCKSLSSEHVVNYQKMFSRYLVTVSATPFQQISHQTSDNYNIDSYQAENVEDYKISEITSEDQGEKLVKDENTEQSINKILNLITPDTYYDIASDNKDLAMLLGTTGVGKSTYVNFLMGCDMELVQLDNGANVVKVKDINEGEHFSAVAEIGHNLASQTSVLNSYLVPNTEINICDTPGFLDNRLAEQNIANAVNLRRGLSHAKSVRFIVFISYSELDTRALNVVQTIAILNQVFGSELSNYKQSILVGITHLPEKYGDRFKDFPALQKFMSSIAAKNSWSLDIDKIVPLSPMPETRHQSLSKDLFLQEVEKLSPVTRKDNLYRTVLDDKSIILLNKVSKEISRQIQWYLKIENLRMENVDFAIERFNQLKSLQFIEHPQIDAEIRNVQEYIITLVNNLKQDVITMFRGTKQQRALFKAKMLELEQACHKLDFCCAPSSSTKAIYTELRQYIVTIEENLQQQANASIEGEINFYINALKERLNAMLLKSSDVVCRIDTVRRDINLLGEIVNKANINEARKLQELFKQIDKEIAVRPLKYYMPDTEILTTLKITKLSEIHQAVHLIVQNAQLSGLWGRFEKHWNNLIQHKTIWLQNIEDVVILSSSSPLLLSTLDQLKFDSKPLLEIREELIRMNSPEGGESYDRQINEFLGTLHQDAVIKRKERVNHTIKDYLSKLTKYVEGTEHSDLPDLITSLNKELTLMSVIDGAQGRVFLALKNEVRDFFTVKVTGMLHAVPSPPGNKNYISNLNKLLSMISLIKKLPICFLEEETNIINDINSSIEARETERMKKRYGDFADKFEIAKAAISDQLNKGFSQPIYKLNLELSRPEECLRELAKIIDNVKLYYSSYVALSEDIAEHSIRYKFIDINVFINEKNMQLQALKSFLNNVVSKVLNQKKAEDIRLKIKNLLDGSLNQSEVKFLNAYFVDLEILDEQRFLSCIPMAEKILINETEEQLTNILRETPGNYISILSQIFNKMDCAIKLTGCFKDRAMDGIKAKIEKNKKRVEEHENSRHIQKHKDLTDRLNTRFGETKLAINQYNIENYREIAGLALNQYDARISLKKLTKHIPVVNQYLSTLNDLQEAIDKHSQQYYFINESNLINLADPEYKKLKEFFNEVSEEVLKKSLLHEFHDNLHLLNENLIDYVENINHSEKIWRSSPLTLSKLKMLNYSVSVVADIEGALALLKGGNHALLQDINQKLDDFFKKMQVYAISKIIRDTCAKATYSSNKNDMHLYLDKLKELDPADIYKKSIADLQASIDKYGGERDVTTLSDNGDYNQLDTINKVLISYSETIHKRHIDVKLEAFKVLMKKHINDLIEESEKEIINNLSLDTALEKKNINNITQISKTSLDNYSGHPSGALANIFKAKIVSALKESLHKISTDILKVTGNDREKLIRSFTLAMIKSYEMGTILKNLIEIRLVMQGYLSELIKSNGEAIRNGYKFSLVAELPDQNIAEKNVLYINSFDGQYAVFDSVDEFKIDFLSASEIDFRDVHQKFMTREFQDAVLNITSRRGHTKKNNMEQILSKAMLEQLDNKIFAETVKALISEFKAYQNLDIGLFNEKICVTFEDALSKVKLEPNINSASIQRLRKIHEVYEKTYSEYINKFIQNNFSEIELDNHISRLKTLLRSTPFALSRSVETIMHTGELLACICALWSYLSADRIWPGERKNLLQPHSTQLLAIFSLLGIDDGAELKNNLCEILTGQGKSVALAITSSFYALLDHEVDVVCYSSYLSGRDRKQFDSLFKELKLDANKINYSTIDNLANLTMKRSLPPLRDLVPNFLRGRKITPTNKYNDKRILLIDEVDVFFGKNFYGDSYNPVVSLDSSSGEILKYLWTLWDKQGENPLPALNVIIAQVRALEASKELLRKYPKYAELFDQAIEEIFTDLSSAFPYIDGVTIKHECICENNSIGYLDKKTGHINFNTRHGYKTAFAYLFYAGQGKIVNDINFESELSIHVYCGHILYSLLPTFYPKILGVTGTLQTLSRTENIILSQYGFQKKTFIPSAFRRDDSNAFVKENTVVFKDYDDYFFAIKSDIENKVKAKRAVLVVFETYELLEIFRTELDKTPLGINYALEILTERCEESVRDAAISRAISKATITLMTRTYGRGTDFVCRDEYLIRNKGVHIALTFAPESLVEEIQIYGRTCRQDNPGSGRMILCAQHLLKQGFLSPVSYMNRTPNLDERGEMSWDDFIQMKRNDLDEKRYAAINNNLSYNTIRYDNTLAMVNEMVSGNDQRVIEILKHEFNPPAVDTTIKKNMTK
jgi:hypothetical protein